MSKEIIEEIGVGEARTGVSTSGIYSASENLSRRIQRQRAYYFLDEKRPHQNYRMSFTTGLSNDLIEPDIISGSKALDQLQEGLRITAETLDLPEYFWKEPLIVRRAMVFQQTLRQIPVDILPYELIVGFRHNTGMSAGLNEEENRKWFEEKTALLKKQSKIMRSIAFVHSAQGHLVADHQTVLEKGFKGLKAEAEESMLRATSQKRRNFYKAVMICCDGAVEFAHRYAEEARRMASEEKDSERSKELLQIAENCDWVPENPPRSFWEAVQMLWFQHMLIMLAENYPGPGTSFGRLDQYMYPYYKKGVEEGKLTEEWAKELIQSFMIKTNYVYDALGSSSPHGRGAGQGQMWTAGGKGLGGKDMTNDLTYLLIKAFYEINMLEPKANIRFHSGSPEKLLKLMGDIARKTQGCPFIFNFDKSVIQSLENEGLSYEEAVDYAPIGCLENTIRGSKAGTVDTHFNLVKAVELIFTRGHDYVSDSFRPSLFADLGGGNPVAKNTIHVNKNQYKVGDLITYDSGDPSELKTFKEFLEAYRSQLKAVLDILMELQTKHNLMKADYLPCPYLSMFITGCMEDGKDVHRGGGRYNPTTINGVGIGTVADSLAAVKKFVFDDKKVAMKELTDALYQNWDGYEDLQKSLWNKAPKFGNDDDYVDLIVRDVSQWWNEYVNSHYTPIGRKFRAGYLSWDGYIGLGEVTMATPDGRKRGLYLSGGIGPVQGQDKNGPTAAIKSVTKLGLETCPSGASYTWTINPSTMKTDEGLKKFIAIIRAYNELGGQAWQTNCVSGETLKDAQKNPVNYTNLLIRITGYNAYFVTIGRALQEEVITRTEHAVC